jgi:hypothetical protein
MAVSTYSTNMTDLFVGAGDKANATALGGGASGLNDEVDYFIQGTGMISKNAFASAKKGMIYNTGSDRASLIGTDGAFVMWTTHATPNSLDIMANGGVDMLVGSSASDYKHWYVGGSDTIEFMGWIFAAVNPSETTDEADTGTPSAVEQYVGVMFDLPTGGPTKGAPNALDAIRAGRCDIIYEFGTSTDPDASFELAVTNRGDVTDRWGLIQLVNGSYFLSGLHQLGSSTNVVNFTDSNKTLFWRDHPAVTAPFNTLDIQNASSVVNMTNISWKALGTKTAGTWTTTDNATVALTTCNFIGWRSHTFDTNTTADTCTFLECGLITLGGADLSGSSILSSSVAADEGAVFDDRTTTAPTNISELDNCTFSQGTNAHHAIRFGTNVDDDITLTGIEFTGFSASNDVNGSTLRFDATTGSINVNLVGCTVDGAAATTSNVGVDDAAGITVTLVVDPVTELVNVKNTDGNNIENARVIVETAATIGGGEMFEAAVTSLTQAAGTATCTTTAVHGLVTGDKVVIRGAQPDGYNKVATVTVSTTTVFTYSVDSGLSSPATGTPVVSFVALHGLTNASGNIQASRTWGAAQQMKGWARKKNATSPFYKDGDISYNIDTSNGNTINVILQPDE